MTTASRLVDISGTDAVAAKLKFAIACSGRGIAAWQARAVRRLLDTGAAGLEAVIVDDRDVASRDSLPWRLFASMSRPQSMRREDLTPFAVNAAVLRAYDVEKIRNCDLDFILSFTAPVRREWTLFGARYGVWTFAFGHSDGPPCFWEICGNEQTVRASLERLSENTEMRLVLREGHLKIVDYLYSRSVDGLLFEVAKWPAYLVQEIAQGLTVRAERPRILVDSRPKYETPSCLATGKFLWIMARNVLRRLFRRGLSLDWSIGIARMRPADLINGAQIENVQWLPPIPGKWFADPMSLRSDDKINVLCEEMRLASGKGQIAATAFDGSSWTAPKRVIATTTHASYPFLFEYRGGVYCVPETHEATEIALYRAREFPTEWERVATLMTGIAAADATIFEHEGLLWLLCVTTENPYDALLAFFAEDILGPWQPHAANPVKIDVRGSRPAGAPFRVDGQLYRPAQDASGRDGFRVVINRIVLLSRTGFCEEPCTYVEPLAGPYEQGLHTLSFAGDYCIIDGNRWVRRAPG